MFNKDLHYTIVGLGITGLSCIEFLHSQDCQNLFVTDTREDPPKLNEFKMYFSDIPAIFGSFKIPANTDIVVISPGISITTDEIIQARRSGAEIIGDIELFARLVDRPVIAVTGANGKSTVVTLIAEMARANGIKVGLGGNVGIPALTLLNSGHELYVLELSSFQLETLYSLKPKVATILNISTDHMDRYHNVEEYRNAKLRIYKNAENIVINNLDPKTFPDSRNDNIIGFDLKHPRSIIKMKLIGEQNILNAQAALTIADIMGWSVEKCTVALEKFPGLPHRCEVVSNFADILWVNDSKATNVGATIVAIKGIAKQITGKIIIILGGDSKKADLTPLINPVSKYCRAAILIGEAKDIFYDMLNNRLPCYMVSDMQSCVAMAKSQALVNDCVLLSPACSSLDMFENFCARGNIFKQEIYNIMEYA